LDEDDSNDTDNSVSEGSEGSPSDETDDDVNQSSDDDISQGSDDGIEIVNPNIDISEDHIISLVGEEVYNFTVGEVRVVDNPSSLYTLVNKLNELPESYIPSDLVVPEVNFTFEGFQP